MEDFTAASRRTLRFLHEHFGLDLWMITRVEGDDWIVLSADDRGYGVAAGNVLKWSDSFCTRMVNGEGPNCAPDAQLVPAYRDAPVGLKFKIGSYIGLPMRQSDGSLFGTLCAISPEKQPPELEQRMDYIRMLADLLSCLLDVELKANAAQRRLERAVDVARTDFLTALYNRRGLSEFVKREEDRCVRYGHPACVISIDLDDLKALNDRDGHARGDAHLQAAAGVISSAVRASDIAARTGGDEFVILCVECDLAGARSLADRIRFAFEAKHIRASMGLAMRRPDSGLNGAMEAADSAMYSEKRRRKAERKRTESDRKAFAS